MRNQLTFEEETSRLSEAAQARIRYLEQLAEHVEAITGDDLSSCLQTLLLVDRAFAYMVALDDRFRYAADEARYGELFIGVSTGLKALLAFRVEMVKV